MTEARHPSTLELDRLRVGAVSPEERERLIAHLGACPDCARRESETVEAEKHFERIVLGHTLPRVRERLEPFWRPRLMDLQGFRWPLGLAAAVGAVGLALLLRVPAEPRFTAKGGPQFHVFVRHAQTVRRLEAASSLHPGDALRFTVDPSGFGYLMIASVDGAGRASIYVPMNGATSEALGGGAHLELPGSVVLDATPGPEHLFALFSKGPLRAGDVTAALTSWVARGAPADGAPRPGESIVLEKDFVKVVP